MTTWTQQTANSVSWTSWQGKNLETPQGWFQGAEGWFRDGWFGELWTDAWTTIKNAATTWTSGR